MPKSMVIVESPAKARTIGKYLGKDYMVRASAGHIKDLPKGALGVDVKHDFHPTYGIIKGKEKIVQALKKAARSSQAIYLAADPDREGEAICQHLSEELRQSKEQPVYRVLFNEITKNAVLNAFENPSAVDRNKVEAQQARRILDRLVGYKVSPLLWQKVRRGLSAGRVQSVALRLIVDREKEIRAFVPREYWNFSARLEAANPPPFWAKAVKHAGKKFNIPSQAEADQLLAELRNAEFLVTGVQKKEKKRSPVPPFVTSTLQQEASRKLRFSVKKTMTLSQRLYEGVEIGAEGLVGLITYMRTDSTRVANSALQEVREFVAKSYGAPYLPARAVVYRKKKKAQDAHEAVRPTSVWRRPEEIQSFLDRDAYRLYALIWKRFIASQMNPARFDQTEIDIRAARTDFKAVGSVMKFEGFLKLYQEGRDEAEPEAKGSVNNLLDDSVTAPLPAVEAGEKLGVEKIVPEQKFTQPPPRYTEATLVKTLEEKGIGRPSTYAQILAVIMDRDYVSKQEGRFVPSDTGEVVTELLIDNFQELFNYDYTAKLEEELDGIEQGGEDWVQTLQQFYAGFSKELKQARENMKDLKKEETPTGISCEKCGGEMVIRWGRFGKFIACSNYPECKNTQEIRKESSSEGSPEEASVPEETCEKCGKPMVLRKGRYGSFLACSGYPECRNTKKTVQENGRTQVQEERPLDEQCPRCGSHLVLKQGRFGPFAACSNYPECRYIKQETTGVPCPECGKGEIVRRKSRRGKTFYGCNAFPDCRFVLWSKPVARECPDCGAPYLLERSTKKEGLIHSCNNSQCSYKAVLEPVSTP